MKYIDTVWWWWVVKLWQINFILKQIRYAKSVATNHYRDTFESKSCQQLIRDVFAGKGGIERKARDYQSIGTIKIL